MGFPPHSLSPTELQAMLAAERKGLPFLAYRDGAGDLRLRPLEGVGRLTVGREAGNDVELSWDAEVSRTHAQLERVGSDWTLADDGLSRNGSFVNGERVVGRRRLRDDDMLRFGDSSVLYRCPASRSQSTVASDASSVVKLSDAERRVLVALCRPLASPGAGAAPASNREIAEELSLSLDGVKTQIKALFAKLEVGDLPQNRKRAELARRALDAGLVGRRDVR